MNRVKIEIIKELCIDPIECRLKCIKSCPYKLLAYIQTYAPPPGEPPEKYEIVSAFSILCNNCGKCVEICPTQAISIELH